MSKYVENNLLKDEEIKAEAKYHWIIFTGLGSFLTLGVYPAIKYFTSEFAVTNKRIIIKSGLLSVNTVEMNNQKVESVNVNQGILGKMMNYGTVSIIGTGGSKEIFHNIKNPKAFRLAFQEATY